MLTENLSVGRIMKVKIEFYYVNNCPRVNEMSENIIKSISKLDFEVEYIKHAIDDKFKDDFEYGCPTLLVNGRDLIGKMKCDRLDSYCRIYPQGIPSEEVIMNFIINSY